jgi:serine/threonine-protein kinase
MTQVGRAVGRAHEAGIIHRDLKLENIFLVRNEDEELVKVLDFGVAKLRDDPLVSKEAGSKALTRTGSLLGTPYYMSPEQAQGNKEIDHRSDLWALAVIAFECLTGKRPFSSDGLGDLVLQICVRDIPVPSDVAPVPIGFDAWFHRATQRDPDERFQSARELIDALRAALGLEERPTMGTVPEIVVSNDIAIQEGEARQSASSVATTPSQFGKSATRVSLTSQPDVDGSAPTIVARREDAGTLTVRQFGTSQAGAPVRAGLGKGLVFAVAAGALIIGLGAGFAVLNPSSVSMWSGKLYNRWLELWGRAPMAETDSSPMSESRRSSEPRPAGVAIGPGVSRSSSSVQGSASARAAAGVSVAGAQKAGVQPAKSAEAGRPAIQRGQILPDGGYARPDWARMDESPKEPPPPPKKEPPPPPPEPAASGVVKDNPY